MNKKYLVKGVRPITGTNLLGKFAETWLSANCSKVKDNDNELIYYSDDLIKEHTCGTDAEGCKGVAEITCSEIEINEGNLIHDIICAGVVASQQGASNTCTLLGNSNCIGV